MFMLYIPSTGCPSGLWLVVIQRMRSRPLQVRRFAEQSWQGKCIVQFWQDFQEALLKAPILSPLDGEAKIDAIAVLYDVIFAFQAHKTFFFSGVPGAAIF